jgi:hypothetical protein
MEHDAREYTNVRETSYMQSEEQAHNTSVELHTIAEPLPQPADLEPLNKTNHLAFRKRLTARRLYQRRSIYNSL